jgi:hypothetical protein
VGLRCGLFSKCYCTLKLITLRKVPTAGLNDSFLTSGIQSLTFLFNTFPYFYLFQSNPFLSKNWSSSLYRTSFLIEKLLALSEYVKRIAALRLLSSPFFSVTNLTVLSGKLIRSNTTSPFRLLPSLLSRTISLLLACGSSGYSYSKIQDGFALKSKFFNCALLS